MTTQAEGMSNVWKISERNKKNMKFVQLAWKITAKEVQQVGGGAESTVAGNRS